MEQADCRFSAASNMLLHRVKLGNVNGSGFESHCYYTSRVWLHLAGLIYTAVRWYYTSAHLLTTQRVLELLHLLALHCCPSPTPPLAFKLLSPLTLVGREMQRESNNSDRWFHSQISQDEDIFLILYMGMEGKRKIFMSGDLPPCVFTGLWLKRTSNLTTIVEPRWMTHPLWLGMEMSKARAVSSPQAAWPC